METPRSRRPITLGSYRLGEAIGQGAFARVFRADGPSGPVAIKLLKRPGRFSCRQLRREIDLLRALPRGLVGVAGYVDSGDTPAGTPWLAMKLIEGYSLRDAMARGPLPETSVRRLGIQLCSALNALHRLGVVHCDLKPDNILLDPVARTVHLIDLGLASDAQGVLRVMQTEQLMAGEQFLGVGTERFLAGTPRWMAPEQLVNALSEGADLVDTQTDTFAVGALLYRALTAEMPWARCPLTPGDPESMRLMANYRRADLARLTAPAGCSNGLWYVLKKALSPDPADRFANAGHLLKALGHLHSTGRALPVPLDCDRTVVDLPILTDAQVAVARHFVSAPAPRRGGKVPWTAVLSLVLVLVL